MVAQTITHVYRFPTIYDLVCTLLVDINLFTRLMQAAATIDEVNALWKGLGYYKRASRLLSGSQIAVTKYKGLLPDNARDLEAHIPGVGRYTAGAVCSIAYGERVPVVSLRVSTFTN